MNGYQSDCSTEKVSSTFQLGDIFAGMGWGTTVVDGHSIESIHNGFEVRFEGKPKAILAKTIKGKGFNAMENNNSFHHARITSSIFEELKGSFNKP